MLTGKGMYIWQIRNCEGAVISDIVTRAINANLSHVLIKIADGSSGYNYIDGVDKAKEVVAAFDATDIEAWGWQFVYGDDPIGEATTANRRIAETGVDGFVVNAEVAYKDKSNQAAQYMNILTDMLPIALSSFRYPEVHPEFPWTQFIAKCDFMMPQVYWMQADNPAEQLVECVEQYEKITDKPIFPTGAAFCEHGWCPAPEEIVEFSDKAKELGMGGINFWEWACARNDGFWNDVKALGWSGEEHPVEPPTDCCEELESSIKLVEGAILEIDDGIKLQASDIESINTRLDNKATKVKLEETATILEDATHDRFLIVADEITNLNTRLDDLEMEFGQDYDDLKDDIRKLREMTIPETNHSHFWQRWFKKKVCPECGLEPGLKEGPFCMTCGRANNA